MSPLSQADIAALLASMSAPDEAAPIETSSHGAFLYNFRRPDRIAKEQLRSLHFLHDRFALNVSTSLSAFLRSITEVTIESVEQFAYSEFLISLPDPTAFYAISLKPLDVLGALELNPSVAFTMIDRMLGGTGEGDGPQRALTEIEQNVVDSVVKLLLENLSETWRAVTNVTFRIHGRETRPQMLQVTGPNEIVILLAFDIRVGDARGKLNLCVPATAIESLGETFAQGWNRARRVPTPEETSWLATNLGRMALPLTAQIGTTLSAHELLALQPGDVLNLGRPASHPINVHAGEVPAFLGHLTQLHGSLAIAVTAHATSAVEDTP